MTTYIPRHRLQVADTLARFIDEEVLPGTGVEQAAFWAGFDALVHDLTPKNRALLRCMEDTELRKAMEKSELTFHTDTQKIDLFKLKEELYKQIVLNPAHEITDSCGMRSPVLVP